MKTKIALIAVSVLLLGAQAAWCESARETFDRAEALLAESDFSGALRAYAEASRAAPDNEEYVQKFMLVRRVIVTRKQIAQESDPAKWRYLAKALHSFYSANRLYDELLSLDQQMHAIFGTSATAMTLAETHIAMDNYEAAVKTLRELDSDQITDASNVLLGIALAHTNKKDEAQEIADDLLLPEDTSPRKLYNAARLHGMLGEAEKAAGYLVGCFESLPPSRIEAFKEHARSCVEFEGINQTEAFKTAMTTESPIHESACSGGSSCAGCPLRGNCPSGQE
jgi:tetratricopeptide (TPR) repeat protein